MSKDNKTNVMRLLEQNNIHYIAHSFTKELGNQSMNLPIYKTLVTQGKSKQHYVFVVPVKKELDLKKAAKVVGEKAIEMIKEKDLLPLTGYVHGGCSPIGMKKVLPTVFDSSVLILPTIIFSAGKVGHSVEIAVKDIETMIPCQFCAVAK